MSVLPSTEIEDSGAASVLPAEEVDATPEAAPVAAAVPETAAEVWARTMENAKPITKDDVRGDRPDAETTVPDRVLVAPELAKLVAKPEPAADYALTQRLAAIEALLAPKPAAAPAPDLTQEVADLRSLLLEEREEKVQALAASERDGQLQALKEGVVANIRSDAERFPALIALDQEENVYHTLVNKLEAGESVSEDDIASEANAKLVAVYQKLHAVLGGQPTEPSEDPKSSDAVDTPTTLTPALTGADQALDVDALLNAGMARRELAAKIWESKQK